ncbi:MAG: glycosyltransferase [Pseudomonadota bacterium]
MQSAGQTDFLSSSTGPNIWVVEIGEPVPRPGEPARTMRAGLIAKMLRARGVNVTWFVSTYSHARKEPVVPPGTEEMSEDGVRLVYLHGRDYQSNVSLNRMINHWQVAQDFRTKANKLPRPDVIYCCYPTIDLAHATTSFGKANGVPVIVDIRDMWPDVLVDAAPVPKPLGKLLISPLRWRASAALGQATNIVATSEVFLNRGLEIARRERRAGDGEMLLAYQPPARDKSALAAARQRWIDRGLTFEGEEKIACMFCNISDVPILPHAIAALEHLPERSARNLKMVICGTGTRFNWFRSEAENHPQLMAPGQVNAEDIFALMQEAKCGLLFYPRRDDFRSAFPNKVGEYLAGSLPIFSTVDGRVGDLLHDQDCGVVTSDTDPSTLAHDLDALIWNDDRLQRQSDNAARIYSECFSAGSVYGAFCDHLMELAGASNAQIPGPGRQAFTR